MNLDELANTPVITANMLRFIDQGWNELHAFLGTLSAEQLTGPTDAAGWTVKDHIIHMAAWENGLCGLLEGQPRWEAMGVDQATWESGFDQVNAIIQQRHRDMPLDEVLQSFQKSHARVLERVGSMTDEDLMRPYSHYQAGWDEERPIFGWIVGNTFGHYAEHKPWIEAIVDQG
jgi:uncharacterized protein (TIGR03083 family)